MGSFRRIPTGSIRKPCFLQAHKKVSHLSTSGKNIFGLLKKTLSSSDPHQLILTHYIWHIFCHSIWHSFWQIQSHIYIYILTFYLAFFVTFYLASGACSWGPAAPTEIIDLALAVEVRLCPLLSAAHA